MACSSGARVIVEMSAQTRTTAVGQESTRNRLVQAAEALLCEGDSEQAVSVRALERRAGVTAPTIYRYFPSMGSLLAEVASRQFARLDAAIEAAAGIEDPIAEITAFGRAFARFGLEHPHEYRVLFMNRASDPAAANDRLRTAAGYHRLVSSVRRVIDDGALPGNEDPEEIANLLILSLHGVISMLIARPDGWGDPEHLIERMMYAVGYGIAPREERPNE
jgi:AcrR family transcriptional regulator